MNLTKQEEDDILARWDITSPAIQRRMTLRLATKVMELEERVRVLTAACERVLTFERWKDSLSDENRAASYLNMLDQLQTAMAEPTEKPNETQILYL